MDDKTLNTISVTTDIIFLSLALLQQITNKTPDQVLDMIRDEGEKTDRLLSQLRE